MSLVQVFDHTLKLIARIPQDPSIKISGKSLEVRGFVSPRNVHDTVIEIKNIDCVDEAILLRKRHGASVQIGLLNMANEEFVGGGVTRGARAQEEDICRRTTLHPSIAQVQYPLAPDELLLTPNVKVVKDAQYCPLFSPDDAATAAGSGDSGQEQLININGVLTSAAPCMPLVSWDKTSYPRRPEAYQKDSDRALMRDKIRTLLKVCAMSGLDHLVLGAWGCGAFLNPAAEVASMFAAFLTPHGGEFSGAFRHITFAILEHDESRLRLNATFQEVFARRMAASPRAGSPTPAAAAVSFDHAYGCLLGAAVGDAAGAVLEFTKGFGQEGIARAMKMPGGGYFKVGPGQITDDTELLLALANALSGQDPRRGLPVERVAQRYHEWANSGPFDIGRTCSVAFLGGPAEGMAARAAAESSGSQANGSLMRVAPVAVWTAALGDPEITAVAGRSDAMLSHPNKATQDANALFCIAIAHLLTHPGDAEGAVAAAEQESILEGAEADPQVLKWLIESKYPPQNCGTNMGWARWAFVLAFAALRKRMTFPEAMEFTLSREGDTDTNAAIVGAMIGALWGASGGIPVAMSAPVLSFDPTRPGAGRQRPAIYAPSMLEDLTRKLVSGPH